MLTGKVPQRPDRPAAVNEFLFLGERLAVDFLNTRIAKRGRPIELLDSPHRLAAWVEAAGLFPGRELLRDFRGRRETAVMKRIREFRETLRQSLVRWSETGRAPAELLTLLNRQMAGDPTHAELLRVGAGVSARRRSTGKPLARALAAIGRSAAEMLQEDDPRRFRKCSDPDCILRFYDVSKAGRRRWCSMNLCGGRAKVRSYYRRQTGNA